MSPASNSESRKRLAAPVLPLVERIAQAVEASACFCGETYCSSRIVTHRAARIVRSFAGEDTQ